MASNDLKSVLKECKQSASVGYKIASAQYKNLNTTLSNAKETINGTLIDFNRSPCYVSSATDLHIRNSKKSSLLKAKRFFRNVKSHDFRLYIGIETKF